MKNIGISLLFIGLLFSCSSGKMLDKASEMSYQIEQIEFFTSVCFGTCPQFKMEIDQDRTAVYEAIRFNFSKDFDAPSPEGIFKGKIKEEDYNHLVQKLNDMGFPKLEDRYAVEWTDDQTANLKITYNHGQVKSIRDYGMRGTPELQEIYQLFLDLRTSQDWVRE